MKARIPDDLAPLVEQLMLLHEVVPGAAETLQAQIEERLAQVREHGGPDRDAMRRDGQSWIELILTYLQHALDEGRTLTETALRGDPITGETYLYRLTQTAALCEAAIEAYRWAAREET